MNEIWKDILGYEGIYKISTLGRVYSYQKNIRGGIFHKGKYLKCFVDSIGYPTVSLRKNNKTTIFRVHRLMLLTFLGKNEKRCVNHLNGIKNDNRLENLEWCTHSENLLHSYKTGLHFPTEKHRQEMIKKTKSRVRNYSFETAEKIRKMRLKMSASEISIKTGVSKSIIRNMVSGYSYSTP